MDRRDFIKGAATGAAALAFSGTARARTSRPNVLIITVDQMRHPMWTPIGVMPNVEKLAAAGVTFNNSFVAAAPCSPSRACIFTGTHTTQNRVLSNCDFVDGKLQPSLDPRIPTMGHLFQRQGYRTPYRGKWHLTRRADRNPDRHNALIDYGFEGWEAPEAFFGGPPYGGEAMDPLYKHRAVKWLDDPQNHEQPWLMVCSFVNPHDIGAWPKYYPQTRLKPIKTEAPPPNWTDDLSTKPGAHREFQKRMEAMAGKIDVNDPDMWRRYLDYYCECMAMADRHVGDVLAALDRTGQRDNTIIVFTSDHGEMAGSHKLRNKGPFAYEENIKVPLIFSWPGVLPEGATTDAMVSNIDLLSTIASLCGISNLPYTPGRDFSASLRDPAAPARDHVIFHNDWEIVYTVGDKTDSMYENPAHIRCLRNHQWKYAYYFSPHGEKVEHELYNLKEDPLEMTNLAADPAYASKMRELSDQLFEQERGFEKDWEAERPG